MTNRRWIAAATEAANEAARTRMPWERGLRRQAMIARRDAEPTSATVVTLRPATRTTSTVTMLSA